MLDCELSKQEIIKIIIFENRQRQHTLCDNLVAVGAMKEALITDEAELEALKRLFEQQLKKTSAMHYNKVELHGELLCTNNTPRVKKTNNYTVAYSTNTGIHYGIITKFVTLDSSTNVTFINPIVTVPTNLFQGKLEPRLKPVSSYVTSDFLSYTTSNELVAIRTTSILMKVYNIHNPSASIIANIVNSREKLC